MTSDPFAGQSVSSQLSHSSSSTWKSHQITPAQQQDQTLKQALKHYRLEQSRLLDVPAFVIFSNQVLDRLVEHKPCDQNSFLAIRGLGPSKWSRYGSDILKVIDETLTSDSSPN